MPINDSLDIAVDQVAPSLIEGGKPKGDPLDQAIDQTVGQDPISLRKSAFIAADNEPDKYAKIIDIAKKLNVPPRFVAGGDYESLAHEAEQRNNNYEQIMRHAPNAAHFLENPDNMAVSKDDLHNVSQIDQLTSEYKNNRLLSPYIPSFNPKGWKMPGDIEGALGRGWNENQKNLYWFGLSQGIVDKEQAIESIMNANNNLRQAQIKKADLLNVNLNQFKQTKEDNVKSIDESFNTFIHGLTTRLDDHNSQGIGHALNEISTGAVGTVGAALDLFRQYTKNPKDTFNQFAEGLPPLSLPLLTSTLASMAYGAGEGAPGGLPGMISGASAMGAAGFAAAYFPGSLGGKFEQAMIANGVDPENEQQIRDMIDNVPLMNKIKNESGIGALKSTALNTATLMFANLFKAGAEAGLIKKTAVHGANIGLMSAAQTGAELVEQASEGKDISLGGAVKGSIEALATNIYFEGMMSSVHGGHGKELTPKEQDAAARFEAIAGVKRGEPLVKVYSKETERQVTALTEKADNAIQSLHELTILNEAATKVKESKLNERSPSQAEELIQMSGGGSKVLYQVDEFDKFFKDKGTSPEQAAEALSPEALKSYQEAKETGGMIHIPVEDYLGKIASVDELKGLSEKARGSRGNTMAEAAEVLKGLPEEIDKLANPEPEKPDSAKQVGEQISKMLEDAGQQKQVARGLGKLIEQRYRTRGELLGRDPLELFNEIKRQVHGPEEAPRVLEALKGDVLPQDVYHATPYRFDKFDMSHIGTGSGSRSFGHGFYFSKDLEFTKTYRKAIADRFDESHILKVDIPEDHELLHWDKKFIDQPQIVKDAFPGTDPNKTGEQLYNETGKRLAPAGDRNTRDQAASEEFLKRGVLGNKYDNPNASREKNTNPNIKDTSAYVIWDPNRLKKFNDTLLQKDQNNIRGFYHYGNSRIDIGLLPKANRSTGLHELIHSFHDEVAHDVELLRSLETRTPNQEAFLKASDAVLKELGAESWKTLTPEQKETFVDKYMRFVVDGKTSSSSMQRVFNVFSKWLSKLYQSLKIDGIKLSPEFTDFFERLTSTDEEITKAKEDLGKYPMEENPAAYFMKGSKLDRYVTALADAEAEGVRLLSKDMFVDQTEQRKSFLDGEFDRLRPDVEHEVNQKKEYIARSILQDGTLPDGTAVKNDIKLSRKAVIEMFGKDTPGELPNRIFGKDGLGPEQAADILGFKNANELIDGLKSTGEKDKVVDLLTQAKVKQLHGDILIDGSLPEAAHEAVHNTKRAQLLRFELEHLASNDMPTLKEAIRKITRAVPTDLQIRNQVERIIGDKVHTEIDPYTYQLAERRARKESGDALTKGDLDGAFLAKRNELINHELYRASIEARRKIEQTEKYLEKFSDNKYRATIGKAGMGFVHQIDAILDRFGVKEGTEESKNKPPLYEFLKDLHTQGYDVGLSDNVMNETFTKNYNDLTYSELLDLKDSVKTLKHIANGVNDFKYADKKIKLEELAKELHSVAAEYYKIKSTAVDLNPSIGKNLAKLKDKAIAAHTKMEFLFNALDGYKPGGRYWETFYKPFADAENHENRLKMEAGKAMDDIFSKYTKKERALWSIEKIYIKELEGGKITPYLTKKNIISVGLNLRNEYNKTALMEGYGWNDKQLKAVIAHLDARDIQTINEIGRHIETYWPEVKRLEEAVNGIAPEKVTGEGYQTDSGFIEGGYYPIKFDAKFSDKQAKLDEKVRVNELFGGQYARAMTKHGHTKERTYSAGNALKLELSVLNDHIGSVIHDLTHREAVINASKLLGNEEIKATIEGAVGKEMYKELAPWLKGIANDRGVESKNFYEGLLSRARNGATIVNLGFKTTSAVVQTLGYLNTVKELGPKYAAQGLQDSFGNPFKIKENWDFIKERSEMMNHRMEGGYDRDVRDAANRLGYASGKSGYLAAADVYTHNVQKSYFHFIGYMDLMTSIPSWMGAYRKAMDGHLENIKAGDELKAIDYADSVVRKTQSAGGAKDLASIQRGSEAFKLFTMFYSQASIQANQFLSIPGEYKVTKDISKLIAGAATLWFAQSLMEDMIRGRGPSSEDDQETWAKWAMNNAIYYPAQQFIGARDLAHFIENKAEGRYANYEMSPVNAAVETVGTAGYLLAYKLFSDEELTRHDIRTLYDAGGFMAGFPTRQTWQTAEYLHDYMTGDEQPANPMEFFWRAAVTGKKRD
jgi:hypothetical protein